MATFEDFKRLHIGYLARAEGLKKGIGTNLALLKAIQRFITEIAVFLRDNRETLSKTQRAKLTLYRDHWSELTEAYR